MDYGFLKQYGLEGNAPIFGAEEFFATLTADERVFWLLRHSVRNHITPQDSDGGAHVGLTPEGRALAVHLGKLMPAAGDIAYFSSPVGRCVDTAKCIQEGRESVGGACGVEVEIAGCLGDYYVKDQGAFQEVLNEKFYPSICQWIADGRHRAFYDLHSRAEELKRFMYESGRAQFNIFCTHDAWIVPTLAHFGGFKFSPSCWMNYLTGVAFVLSRDGRERIVAVTGMDNGYLVF